MYKKIIILCLSLFVFAIGISSVKADNITYKRLNDIYFNLTVDGKKDSNYVTMFYLNDRLAYCIEPGKDITTKIYDAFPNWEKTNLTKEKQNYIEKLGYYGYEYPGHKTDRYYIATQELIWRAVRDIDVYWTNSKNEIIDVTKEKNDILSLVKNHELKPSFILDGVKGDTGSKQILEDTNKVLNDYTVSQTKYHQVSIEDNKLIIEYSTDDVEEEITLTRNKYDQKTLLVYIKEASQQLAALRLSSNEELKFKISSQSPPTEIVRVPSTDNPVIKRFNTFYFGNMNVSRFN